LCPGHAGGGAAGEERLLEKEEDEIHVQGPLVHLRPFVPAGGTGERDPWGVGMVSTLVTQP